MQKRYRLYFDESGDHTKRDILNPAKRYLGLTGIIIEMDYYRTTFYPNLEKLKQENFPHNPDDPVILHRSDIINRKGAFGVLCEEENEEKFNDDLINFFETHKYIIVTVVIDKYSHFLRYQDAALHPYHYCLAAMLERYCGFLNIYNVQGDVMGESRGGEEDSKLKEAYHTVYVAGTNQRNSSFFTKVLTSHEIKLKKKETNIAGLQIADLLAFPSKQEILLDRCLISNFGDIFGKRICQVIQGKYNQQIYQNRIEGYGKIFLS